jgi:Trypsin
MPARSRPVQAWRDRSEGLWHAAMKFPLKILMPLAASALLSVPPAHAIVGGGAPSSEGVGSAVVTIVGSRGNFCSGSLIAPTLVLTVAHCVQPGADYKIVAYDKEQKPQLQNVKRVAIHPAFQMQAMLAHRATADVALLQLEITAKGKTPATLGAPLLPVSPGAKFMIAGIGVTVRGDGKSGGITRDASLVATGKPGNLQIRLVDPATEGARDGLGACTGDSGGPVFEEQQGGPVIVGVISWSTGPNSAAGCGGLTGVTPLTLYRDWILQTARQWGFAL